MAASVLKINDKDWRALGKLAMYRAYLGEYDEAETIVERVMQNGAHLSEVSYFAAHTYLMLGRANDALAALAQAIDLGYPVLLISKDPELDALHEYERFRLLTASTQ